MFAFSNVLVDGWCCVVSLWPFQDNSALNITNTDVSKYPLISKNIVWTHFLFIYVSTHFSQTTHRRWKRGRGRPPNNFGGGVNISFGPPAPIIHPYFPSVSM